MLKGIANSEKVKFTLKGDDDNPTIFWIKNISHEDKLVIWGDIYNPDGSINNIKAASKSVPIFIAGVAGIENLGGNNFDKIDMSVANKLTTKELNEVVEAISNYNFQSKLEIKN